MSLRPFFGDRLLEGCARGALFVTVFRECCARRSNTCTCDCKEWPAPDEVAGVQVSQTMLKVIPSFLTTPFLTNPLTT